MQSSRRQILVINGKGGCGKTTIATNLAVTYACKRKNVILIDNDPQASSTAWANIRSTKMPPVTTTPRYERLSMYQTQSFQNRLPNETDIVIVDGNSNARGRDLDDILKDTDIILIPMLPFSYRHQSQRPLYRRSFDASPLPGRATTCRCHCQSRQHHEQNIQQTHAISKLPGRSRCRAI